MFNYYNFRALLATAVCLDLLAKGDTWTHVQPRFIFIASQPVAFLALALVSSFTIFVETEQLIFKI